VKASKERDKRLTSQIVKLALALGNLSMALTSLSARVKNREDVEQEHSGRLDALENEVSALSEDAGRAFVPFGEGAAPVVVKAKRSSRPGSVKDEPTDRT